MAVVPLSRMMSTCPLGGGLLNHLHQAADAAVHKRAVANDTDHASRLFRWQHMTQPQAHAKARAHANAGIHGFKGFQHAQRVATDVARHNASRWRNASNTRPILARVAQLRRLARQLRQFGGDVVV